MSPVVGIFSRDNEQSYRFLSDALRAEGWEVRCFTITNNNQLRFRDEASCCHLAILYHSKNRGRLNITNVTDSLYDEEITLLSDTLGKKNVIVVVDDVDRSSSGVKTLLLQNQPLLQEKAENMFLISKAEKFSQDLLKEKLTGILSHISKRVTQTRKENICRQMLVGAAQVVAGAVLQPLLMVVSIMQLVHRTTILCVQVMMPVQLVYRAIQGDRGHVATMSFFSCLVSCICYPCALLGLLVRHMWSSFCCPVSSRRTVGIFSRSASDDYEWLTRALNSSMFKNLVNESMSVYISNREEETFRDGVQNCDFTILYHTKNRGRINITNVTDSMYDEQLEYMSSYKGRVNVIVVVDDLEKADYEEKRRIIRHQPDIMKHAQDLVLVTANEKRHPHLLDPKLQSIKDLISAGSWRTVTFYDYLASMTGWVCRNVSWLLCCEKSKMPRSRDGGDLDSPLLA
ncbi:uncharacterized protein [Engystomops pustulosus]|uniref:uncharacterized protein isoform X3 n=1 Tax=Engystomops pustulosus TaxID=76066 RepID=UPI003AFACAC9